MTALPRRALICISAPFFLLFCVFTAAAIGIAENMPGAWREVTNAWRDA